MTTSRRELMKGGLAALLAAIAMPKVVEAYSIDDGHHGAGAASQTHIHAARAEGGIRDCGEKFEGQSGHLNKCIADELEELADKLERPQTKHVAPRAAPVLRRAARRLRKRKTKRGGISVLRKARAVLRKLAATTSSDTKRTHTRVAKVLTVAINVIRTKGGV